MKRGGFFGARATIVQVGKLLLFNSCPRMGAIAAFLGSEAGSISEMQTPEAFQIAQEHTIEVDDKTQHVTRFTMRANRKEQNGEAC